jgi:hypothetical protein
LIVSAACVKAARCTGEIVGIVCVAGDDCRAGQSDGGLTCGRGTSADRPARATAENWPLEVTADTACTVAVFSVDKEDPDAAIGIDLAKLAGTCSAQRVSLTRSETPMVAAARTNAT